MTDHGILFSAPMVRALLMRRKTQTRRVINLPTKGQYIHPQMGGWEATTVGDGNFATKPGGPTRYYPEKVAIWHRTTGKTIVPRFQKGDRLWARETWRTEPAHDRLKPRDIPAGAPILTMADTGVKFPSPFWGKVRQAIFMPRWASRLTLTLVEVRVQRLQDISEDDVIEEGLRKLSKDGGQTWKFGLPDRDGWPGRDDDGWPWSAWSTNHKYAFACLWDQVHGEDAWAENPWVAALTFDVEKRNIDA